MKKNIKEWKELFKEMDLSTKRLKEILETVLENIKFLESIYIVGGDNYDYSDDFNTSAHKERQELCQKTSAIYSLLREKGIKL